MTTTTPCPRCPDGHPDPARGKPWASFIDPNPPMDGKTPRPTSIYVCHPAGEHVAESDTEWINQRLNGSAATEPAEALDVLQRLAAEDELGRQLPGLGAVVQVLRDQIAAALLGKEEAEEAERKKALAAKASAAAAGYAGGPLPVRSVIESMTAGQARMQDAIYREMREQATWARRGISRG